MEQSDFLYLSEQDTIKAGLLDMSHSVNNAEDVFRLVTQGDYLMGGPTRNEHGQRICFPPEPQAPGMPAAAPGYSFMAMPAYVGGRFHICGEKWYGANPRNLQYGLPRAYHMVMLNEVETGKPLALMAATLLSAVRSGAAPGVAARYLAGAGVKRAAFIGAGLMNRAAILALDQECPSLEEIVVYDILPEKCQAYCEEMDPQVRGTVHPAATLEEALCGADLIHTGQSNSFPIQRAQLKEGAILLISSFVSLEKTILENANLVFDYQQAHRVWLETDPDMGLPTFDALRLAEQGNIRPGQMCDLGEVIQGRSLENREFTVFYWMGMPVSDIALAADLYRTACEKGIGTRLSLWDKPYWS